MQRSFLKADFIGRLDDINEGVSSGYGPILKGPTTLENILSTSMKIIRSRQMYGRNDSSYRQEYLLG